jgi:hypothetical protein
MYLGIGSLSGIAILRKSTKSASEGIMRIEMGWDGVLLAVLSLYLSLSLSFVVCGINLVGPAIGFSQGKAMDFQWL